MEIFKTVYSCGNTPPTQPQLTALTHKDKDLHASACLIDSVLLGERMAGSTAAAQCAFASDTPQVEWPRRYPMCTFPVMFPKFPFKPYFQSMWASKI